MVSQYITRFMSSALEKEEGLLTLGRLRQQKHSPSNFMIWRLNVSILPRNALIIMETSRRCAKLKAWRGVELAGTPTQSMFEVQAFEGGHQVILCRRARACGLRALGSRNWSGLL